MKKPCWFNFAPVSVMDIFAIKEPGREEEEEGNAKKIREEIRKTV